MAHRGILRKLAGRTRATDLPARKGRAPAVPVYRILAVVEPVLEKAIVGMADTLENALHLAGALRDGGTPLPLLIVLGTSDRVFGRVVQKITE